MQKRAFIKVALALAILVLALVAVDRSSSLYSDYRYEQRERQLEQLREHFDAYQHEHGGHMPPDLSALVSSRQLEPELRRLIEAGHVSYTAPKDYSWGYDWHYSIDGQGYFVSVNP